MKSEEEKKESTNVIESTENKPKDEEPKKKKKSVSWDWKTLEEQELDRKLHPVLMKITEPKTPYTPYEGEDEYLQQLREINKIHTDDVLDKVTNELENKKRKDSEDSEEYLEVEIINGDGTTRKELVKKEHQHKKGFDEKRQMAYKNEFTEAKKYFDAHKAPDNNLVQTTLKNTLKNKFVGKKEEDELNN